MKFKLEGSEFPEEENQNLNEEVTSEETSTEETIQEEVVSETSNEEVVDESVSEELAEPIEEEVKSEEKPLTEETTATDKDEIPEDVKKYLEFKKETGRSYSDFLEYQKEATDFKEEDLIKQLLRNKNPEFSESEIEDEFYDIFGYDEDLDDESDIKKKQREYKKALSEAKSHFDSMKEKYRVPLGSNEDSIPEDYKEAKRILEEMQSNNSKQSEVVEQQTQYFLNETDKVFSDDFKGFEFKIGDDVIVHKPSNVAETKATQTDISNFFKKFIDENGLIKDTASYHKALYMAMNYETVLKNVYETARAKAIEEEVRSSKNIDMGMKSTPESIKTGIKMKIIS